MERERVRQRLLHALEALSVAFVRSGRCAEAIEVAMLAVSNEPLRRALNARSSRRTLPRGTGSRAAGVSTPTVTSCFAN